MFPGTTSLIHSCMTGWWFQTCFIFHFIYGMSSFPLSFIFFKMVKTINQIMIIHVFVTMDLQCDRIIAIHLNYLSGTCKSRGQQNPMLIYKPLKATATA